MPSFESKFHKMQHESDMKKALLFGIIIVVFLLVALLTIWLIGLTKNKGYAFTCVNDILDRDNFKVVTIYNNYSNYMDIYVAQGKCPTVPCENEPVGTTAIKAGAAAYFCVDGNNSVWVSLPTSEKGTLSASGPGVSPIEAIKQTAGKYFWVPLQKETTKVTVAVQEV